MSNEDFQQIETFLAANPGAIADEIGVSPVIMGRLEAEGKVIRVGKRSTGKRGRPPVEWALPGQGEVDEAGKIPKLARISDELRTRADESELRILQYIETVFSGKKMVLNPASPAYGTWVSATREGDEGENDYKGLAARYKSVVGQIQRRVGAAV